MCVTCTRTCFDGLYRQTNCRTCALTAGRVKRERETCGCRLSSVSFYSLLEAENTKAELVRCNVLEHFVKEKNTQVPLVSRLYGSMQIIRITYSQGEREIRGIRFLWVSIERSVCNALIILRQVRIHTDVFIVCSVANLIEITRFVEEKTKYRNSSIRDSGKEKSENAVVVAVCH